MAVPGWRKIRFKDQGPLADSFSTTSKYTNKCTTSFWPLPLRTFNWNPNWMIWTNTTIGLGLILFELTLNGLWTLIPQLDWGSINVAQKYQKYCLYIPVDISPCLEVPLMPLKTPPRRASKPLPPSLETSPSPRLETPGHKIWDQNFQV